MRIAYVGIAPLLVVWLAIGAAEKQSVPMQSDRVADSYEVYAEVLKTESVPMRAYPQKYWLVEETTLAVTRAGEVCAAKNDFIGAPAERQTELQQVLDDFVKRCHERTVLDAGNFHALLPVRLADDATKKRYVDWAKILGMNHDQALAAEFENKVVGLHSFSEVYFNPQHTLAMVYRSLWCGMQCGNARWVVLEKKDGKWHELPWGYGATVWS
jgi:hypothetical protein